MYSKLYVKPASHIQGWWSCVSVPALCLCSGVVPPTHVLSQVSLPWRAGYGHLSQEDLVHPRGIEHLHVVEVA